MYIETVAVTSVDSSILGSADLRIYVINILTSKDMEKTSLGCRM